MENLFYEHLNPSEVNHLYWVYCIDDYLYHKYPSYEGKWMMYFRTVELDIRWRRACELYMAGKLIGVNSMKVSTAKHNPVANFAPGMGMIIFYCGPSEDKDNLIEYGKNILDYFYYEDQHMFYKSDKLDKILYYIDTQAHYNWAGGRRDFLSKQVFSPNRNRSSSLTRSLSNMPKERKQIHHKEDKVHESFGALGEDKTFSYYRKSSINIKRNRDKKRNKSINDPVVNAAATNQANHGNSFTMPRYDNIPRAPILNPSYNTNPLVRNPNVLRPIKNLNNMNPMMNHMMRNMGNNRKKESLIDNARNKIMEWLMK